MAGTMAELNDAEGGQDKSKDIKKYEPNLENKIIENGDVDNCYKKFDYFFFYCFQ